MAIRRLRSTITLITEYEPNINIAQNLVKPPSPASSKASNSTSPNEAQNKDWEVSNKLVVEGKEICVCIKSNSSYYMVCDVSQKSPSITFNTMEAVSETKIYDFRCNKKVDRSA